jgi:hypothetical protein
MPPENECPQHCNRRIDHLEKECDNIYTYVGKRFSDSLKNNIYVLLFIASCLVGILTYAAARSDGLEEKHDGMILRQGQFVPRTEIDKKFDTIQDDVGEIRDDVSEIKSDITEIKTLIKSTHDAQ